MSRLPVRVGSAEREVLFKLTGLVGQRWGTNSPALYESRAFTQDILLRLAGRGFVRETLKDDCAIYTLTGKGLIWSQKNQLPN